MGVMKVMMAVLGTAVVGNIAAWIGVYVTYRNNQVMARNNQLVAEQNRLLQGDRQVDASAMPTAPESQSIIRRYWPFGVMAVLTLTMWSAVAYDLHDRYSANAIIHHPCELSQPKTRLDQYSLRDLVAPYSLAGSAFDADKETKEFLCQWKQMGATITRKNETNVLGKAEHALHGEEPEDVLVLLGFDPNQRSGVMTRQAGSQILGDCMITGLSYATVIAEKCEFSPPPTASFTPAASYTPTPTPTPPSAQR
jgi:hypothetical protein